MATYSVFFFYVQDIVNKVTALTLCIILAGDCSSTYCLCESFLDYIGRQGYKGSLVMKNTTTFLKLKHISGRMCQRLNSLSAHYCICLEESHNMSDKHVHCILYIIY